MGPDDSIMPGENIVDPTEPVTPSELIVGPDPPVDPPQDECTIDSAEWISRTQQVSESLMQSDLIDQYIDEIAYLRCVEDAKLIGDLRTSILDMECADPAQVTVMFDSPPEVDAACEESVVQVVADYRTLYELLQDQRALEACVLQILESQCATTSSDWNSEKAVVENAISLLDNQEDILCQLQ